VHPPKVETFDLVAGTNTDPKGFVRRVDEYRVEPFGLYLSRPIVDHPTMRWIESWLLPDLGIRVTDWWWHPGHERDQDYYVDIVGIERGRDVWHTVDHYLDIVVRTGRGATVVDVDEFVAAVAAGLLTARQAEHALACSHAAVAGLAAHGHDLNAWLADHGIVLTWEAGPDRIDRTASPG
jgi:predicted RNA-binding protein associated with RNAse of E/G family